MIYIPSVKHFKCLPNILYLFLCKLRIIQAIKLKDDINMTNNISKIVFILLLIISRTLYIENKETE